MAYLRIVTWNCGMAPVRKARSLLALNSDIAVVQEPAGSRLWPRTWRSGSEQKIGKVQPFLPFLRDSFLILLASIREQRAVPGIGLGAARNTSPYLRKLSSFACLIACYPFPSRGQSAARFTAGQWLRSGVTR